MELFFVITSGVLSIAGTIPYIWDIVKGRTKPRLASWFTWSLLTSIATVATFAEGHLASAVLSLCITLGCVTIATLAVVKHGFVSFERFDIICQIMALAGLGLWYVFKSAAIAVVVVVIVDLIAALPTVRHAWKAPHEETLFNFLMAGIASCVIFFAITEWAVVAILYHVYLVVINFGTVGVILLAKRRISKNTRHVIERL